MDTAVQRSTLRTPRRWSRSPLTVGLIIAVVWAALVLASVALWRFAGFEGGDSWGMAVGLMAYVALMLTAGAVIAVGLICDGRRMG
jgi:hypothetical protein